MNAAEAERQHGGRPWRRRRKRDGAQSHEGEPGDQNHGDRERAAGRDTNAIQKQPDTGDHVSPDRIDQRGRQHAAGDEGIEHGLAYQAINDGSIDVTDLLNVIMGWGECEAPPQ